MNDKGFSEQVADSWKVASLGALGKCVECLRKQGVKTDRLAAIAVDGTSGSIVFLDKNNTPLYPGILHNDTRASEEADYLNEILAAHCAELGYRFGATFALSKIFWFSNRQPLLFKRVHHIAHQSDYVISYLTGCEGFSDPSNALKTGYHLIREDWPPELEALGIRALLPKVIPSGEMAGTVLPNIADNLGISSSTPVLTGLTDSTAAFLATGAAQPGEFAVCLGTTLAFKGISRELVKDPQGSVYCHRHPAGGWLPGAASNVGGACLKAFFPNRNLRELDYAISGAQTQGNADVRECGRKGLRPSSHIGYPLVEVGERFPFDCPRATGFYLYDSSTLSEEEHYLSLLQGVALVEKWCFARFAQLGIQVQTPLYTTGKGSNSDIWCQIRAHTLQMPIARSRSTDSAFGMAVLAAARMFYEGNLELAIKTMTGIERIFAPDPSWAGWAEENLAVLQKQCAERGWI
jgi:xylulokinase